MEVRKLLYNPPIAVFDSSDEPLDRNDLLAFHENLYGTIDPFNSNDELLNLLAQCQFICAPDFEQPNVCPPLTLPLLLPSPLCLPSHPQLVFGQCYMFASPQARTLCLWSHLFLAFRSIVESLLTPYLPICQSRFRYYTCRRH